ncbi:MAG: HAMP domain-containing histidine kinase [Actinomycetota bacterium]|nr:HAMP domain-containing histidine kinase [Actinomycetota bacterium]
MSRRRWDLLVITAVGLTGAALVAASGGISGGEAVRLVVQSVLGATVTGLVAWAVLFALRRRPIGVQAAVAALAPVLAVGLGVGWAASQMFITSHDLWVLWVLLVGAGTAGLVVALLLGRRLADASAVVGEMARRLGEHGPGASLTRPGPAGDAPRPHELAALATELVQTSARLSESQAKAAALERSRRELVAWVSHDLRTPLAGIRAMVEALEDGVVDDPETTARYHRTIRHEADRLAGLVDDLFELSRIQAGSLTLDLQRVALDELISDAVAGVAIAARAKGVVLCEKVGEPPPVVELSTPEMARVVCNLLDNAIHHTPAGEAVVVHAALDDTGTAAEVWVQDRCGGIPEPELDRIFEMAYRGDSARTPGDGGAGVGLAVARGLVEAHHGRISVANEGGGCRFLVSLPLSHPGGPPARQRR